MRRRNFWLLYLSLVLCSGALLIDKLVVAVPDPLAAAATVLAAAALVTYIGKGRRAK